MPHGYESSIERRLRHLAREVEELKQELADHRGECEDHEPSSPSTGRSWATPSEAIDESEYEPSAEPGSVVERARRRYRRETTPDRVSPGLGPAPGRIFGESVARYAASARDQPGDGPLDLALRTVSRYRRHHE
jgi:hypothetical protein